MLNLGISIQNMIIYLSFLVAAVLVFVCALVLWRKFKFKCNADLLGAATWSISDSWASTFTGVSAVLGLFLALGLEFSVQALNQDGFGLLNFLFAVIVLVAGFAYKATGKEVQVGTDSFFKGKVWAFLLSAFLTLWAVFGQIFGFIAVLSVLRVMLQASRVQLILFLVLMVFVIVLLVIHTWRSLHAVFETQLAAKVKGLKTAPPATLKRQIPLL